LAIPKHSIRFGKSSEKKVLEEHQGTFESIVLNASSLAHFAKSLSTFILIKSKGKCFFIDPQTHAFQHPLDNISNDKGEIKTSINKIIEHYGAPLIDVILNLQRPLLPKDFSDDILCRQFAKNVLNFQEEHLFNSLEKDFQEYLQDEQFENMIPSKPIFLVAPYFYMTESNYKEWMPINRKFVEISRDAVEKNQNVYGELVIDKNLLMNISEDNKAFEEIVDIYIHADGILFWIDGFDEHMTNKDFLKLVIRFIKKTKNKFPNKPILNLYGGYFSQLLLRVGLHGVVHGPEYGENRAVVPVGGGFPIAKYYYPKIKKRIPSNEMIWLLKSQQINKPKEFFQEICNCKVCKSNIGDDTIKYFIKKFGQTKPASFGKGIREFPVQETVENCLSHYLEVKKKEFNDINKKELPTLLKELENTYNKFLNQIWIDNKEIWHLKEWVEAFRNG
jgi:hypothetical protein